RLAEYLQMDLKDVIAIGDGDNDFEMVRDAGIGIAMGNAAEKVKRVAKIVTSDVGDDGVYQALMSIGLIK
ncbi:MAG TPA: HAD hydrolase family protein, partial [Bacilli bacterium]|nr:HAD hydrolase family protein [Bacilli bacterium]